MELHSISKSIMCLDLFILKNFTPARGIEISTLYKFAYPVTFNASLKCYQNRIGNC